MDQITVVDQITVKWTPELSQALSRLIDAALRAGGLAALDDATLLKTAVNAAVQPTIGNNFP